MLLCGADFHSSFRSFSGRGLKNPQIQLLRLSSEAVADLAQTPVAGPWEMADGSDRTLVSWQSRSGKLQRMGLNRLSSVEHC